MVMLEKLGTIFLCSTYMQATADVL